MLSGLLVLILAVGAMAIDGGALVRTPKGAMRGTTLTSRNGRTIYAFRGIRYALPPTGERRFKAPVPSTDLWTGVFNASEDKPSCPQGNDFINGPISEDCLFLNVYTTKIPFTKEDDLHPVIVLFHPGAWFAGSGQSNLAGPHYLLDENVVFVSINHRLGAFGFLSTGCSESPGNYALKDQQLALQWVRDNVQHFGGDPNSVTLFGSTSGAASAQYHMLSPHSAGLFHRVIAASGSCLCSWALNKDPLTLAKRQAALLDCPHDENTSAKELMDCIKTKDTDEISKSFHRLREWNRDPYVIYAPVIEPEGSSDQPFLIDEPAKLLYIGNYTQVPVLTGVIKDEMIGRAYEIINNETLLSEFNEKFDQIAPYSFYFYNEKDPEISKEMSESIKDFYFKSPQISKEALKPAAEMLSDSYFLYGVDKAVKMISKTSKEPVYFYYMTYEPTNKSATELEPNESTGPAATNDLSYLLYSQRLYPFYGNDHPEEPFSKLLVRIWTKFARTGNPTPDENDSLLNVTWKPHTDKELNYMDLNTNLEMKKAVLQERANFWQTIYKTGVFN